MSSGVKFRIDNTFGGASVASAIVDNGITDFELSSTPYTYSSVISGSGTLQLQVVQPSGGVLILTNANTFSGAVQLGPNGTLQIGNGGTTGSIGDVSVTGGGTLSFKRSDTITFGGTITNSILQQAGTGTLILTGASTMQVTVLSGTLQLNDGGAGSNTITTQALINGTMIINRSDTTTITGNVIGTGQLVQAGTGTTVLAASALDLATTYLVSAGTLQFGTTTAGPAVDIRSKVIDNSVVNIVNATINTNISGSGSVVVASGGYANLAAAQSYTGGTFVSAGAHLDTTGVSSLQGAVVNNGLVDFRSSGAVYSGAMSGSGSVVMDQQGTVTFTGTNTYTGGTTINTGVLQIGNGGTTGSIAGNVQVNGTGALNFDRSDTVTFGGTITGGVVQQIGSGTLILTGPSTMQVSVLSGTMQFNDGSGPGSILVNTQALINGTLIVNRSDTTTFTNMTGVIGTGQLIQAGTGTTVLATATVSIPSILVSGGTLQLGTSSTGATVSGTITDNSLVALSNSTVTGNITGSGAVTVTSGGTGQLSGSNSYTGGTTVQSGGTLTVASAGALQGSVVDNGTVVFATPGGQTYGGAISGTGSATIASQTVFTGGNTYTGGTTVNAGVTLQIGNGGTTGSVVGAVALGSGATLAFDRSDTSTFAGTVTGTGTVSQIGTGTTIVTGSLGVPVTISAGTLQLGNGGTTGSVGATVTDNAALVINRSDTYTVGGAINGTGTLAIAGPGTVVLNGTNGLTGLTTVTAGTLEVGSAPAALGVLAGSVAVQSAGTLKGYGTILGAVSNAGTVAPGGSIGTLTVGSFSQGASGTLAIEIGGAQSDLLNVNGAASLGGTLALTFVTPPTAGASRILAANSITGTFASVTTSGLGGSVFGVSYRPTEVDVVTQGANAGEAVSGFARDSFQTLLDLHDIALAHAATAYCHGADAPASPTAMPECQSFTVWRQLNVGGGAVDGSGAIDGYSTRWIGATAGIDYHSDGDFAFGVFASYARKTLGVHTSGDTVTTDAVALGASAGMQALGGDLATLLTYGASFGQSRRAVATAAGTVIARGSPRGDQFGASLQYDHDVLLPGLSIRARAGYADITQDAFAETDGSLYDLAFQRGDFSNWYASAELRYRHAFRLRSGTMVIPDIGAGVRTIMGQDNYALATNFANATGPAFVTAGPPRQDASATLDLGLTIEGRRGDAIFIRAQGSANGSEQEGLVSVGGHFAL